MGQRNRGAHGAQKEAAHVAGLRLCRVGKQNLVVDMAHGIDGGGGQQVFVHIDVATEP